MVSSRRCLPDSPKPVSPKPDSPKLRLGGLVEVQTVGRETSWAKDVWANYFLGDSRLGDNIHFKKDVSSKDGWRQRPKQFASQCSTLVRATVKVNGKPPILESHSP